ncbi:MAG: DUF3343 domain-containing protein [Clostridia bacterium]|nr:DUF3343 domain-containing protein [Clostridia bacterium]
MISYLVIFHTFSGVMQLERSLKSLKMPYETMPAPRKLSVDCGVSIVFECDDFDGFIKEINTNNIHRIYEIWEENYILKFDNY